MEEGVLHQDSPTLFRNSPAGTTGHCAFGAGETMKYQQLSIWKDRRTIDTRFFLLSMFNLVLQLVVGFCRRPLWLSRRIWRKRPPQRYTYVHFCIHDSVQDMDPGNIRKRRRLPNIPFCFLICIATELSPQTRVLLSGGQYSSMINKDGKFIL